MSQTRTSAAVLPILLAACGGANATTPASPFGAVELDRQTTSVARGTAPAHPDTRKTWISGELAKTKAPVLFVSDSGSADVYIYSLPALKLVGTITGFSQPQGECSDSKGNVWVTDTNAQTIYELDHHGRLENELSDTTGYPVGCAIDPSSGTLAVTNLFGTGSASGNVLMYSGGSQSGGPFQNASQFLYNFASYDGSGNLFFDGRDAGGNFMLSELPKGALKARTVKVSGGTIYFPGMVQWISTKHDLIVGDQSCDNAYQSCLYSVAISKSGGAIIKGKIELQNPSGGHVCDLVQGVKNGNDIDGSDFNFCGSGSSATEIWPYPGGGSPTDSNDTTDSVPVGAAISK